MKTSRDPRHQKRVKEVKALFVYDFQRKNRSRTIAPIIDQLEDIDANIQNVAPEWPIDKIAKIDLAILRLAVYELMFAKDAPPKVIIDEAVELAKSYGNEGSPKFINGALGALINIKDKM